MSRTTRFRFVIALIAALALVAVPALCVDLGDLEYPSLGQYGIHSESSSSIDDGNGDVSSASSSGSPELTDTASSSASGSSGSSVACLVKNCNRCVSGLATQCNSCKNGYKRTSDMLCEMQCRVVNCAACTAASNTQCLTCANGYKRNSNYLCVKVISSKTTYSAAAAPASLWLAAGTAVAAVAAIVL